MIRMSSVAVEDRSPIPRLNHRRACDKLSRVRWPEWIVWEHKESNLARTSQTGYSRPGTPVPHYSLVARASD